MLPPILLPLLLLIEVIQQHGWPPALSQEAYQDELISAVSGLAGVCVCVCVCVLLICLVQTWAIMHAFGRGKRERETAGSITACKYLVWPMRKQLWVH